MQDKVLCASAEMENFMDRTGCEAENSKKIDIQSFARCLLVLEDNFERASSVIKESFSIIDSSGEFVFAENLFNRLQRSVEMNKKQLSEVLKEIGMEKFDPTNEPFDPQRHNAVFQIPDGSKPYGTVAVVLKEGYTLEGRVIRPAEVGVTLRSRG